MATASPKFDVSANSSLLVDADTASTSGWMANPFMVPGAPMSRWLFPAANATTAPLPPRASLAQRDMALAIAGARTDSPAAAAPQLQLTTQAPLSVM